MEKTIEIGGRPVKLSNNIGWTMVYRDQFGSDIVPALMPMMASAMDIISGLIKEAGLSDSVSLEDFIKLLDGDTLLDAVIHLGGLEFVDFVHIVWAMAKAADNSIPDPKEWVKGFDSFPIDAIAPVVGEMVVKGCMSSKNLMRLKSLLGSLLQPSDSTTLSSQDSNAG